MACSVFDQQTDTSFIIARILTTLLILPSRHSPGALAIVLAYEHQLSRSQRIDGESSLPRGAHPNNELLLTPIHCNYFGLLLLLRILLLLHHRGNEDAVGHLVPVAVKYARSVGNDNTVV